MKSLAETIREVLDLVNEASGNLEYALYDLDRESGGNPTAELADDIAADYAGVTAEKLLAVYPEWKKQQEQKKAPEMDPAKAAEKAKWDKSQQQKADKEAQDKRIADRKAEMQAKKDAFKADHAEEIAAAEAYMETFKQIPGWEASNRLNGYGEEADGFTISKDGIEVAIWHEVEDRNGHHYDANHPFTVHFDIVFVDHKGTKRTFTRRGIDVSSMSVGSKFGEQTEVIPAEAVIQQIEDKVAAAVERGKGFVEVPGSGGLSVLKDKIQEIASKIKAGGHHNLMPSGMGIGWQLMSKPTDRWSREAPAEMKKFFGIENLYMNQIDAD